MKILIVGPPDGGQKRAVEIILGKPANIVDWEGAMFNHTFDAKYFTVEAGVWIDQFPASGAGNWAEQFASEEAKEVRDVLCMIIYTFEKADRAIEPFIAKLREEDWRGTLAALPLAGLDKQSAEVLDDLDIMAVEREELLDTIHTALFDWLDEDDGEPEIVEDEDDIEEIKTSLTEPLIPIDELDTILAKLKIAREDETMSREEKMKLAEQLASQLIP